MLKKQYVGVRVDFLRYAAKALREKAHIDAGHSQAPDLFNKEDTLEWETAKHIEACIAVCNEADSPFNDVLNFNAKFGLLPNAPGTLSRGMSRKRADQMREELREFEDACADGDPVKAVDALIDSIYFAYGAAIMMGITPAVWEKCWAAVHQANMAKQYSPEQAGSTKHGIVKPVDWQSPDKAIAEALAEIPFAICDLSKEER